MMRAAPVSLFRAAPVGLFLIGLMTAWGCGRDADPIENRGGQASAPAPSAMDAPVARTAPPVPADRTAPEPRPGTEPNPAGSGGLVGKVVLRGAPPTMKPLKRDDDPYCARTGMLDEGVVVGGDGGLANVVVRLAPGSVPGKPKAAAQPVRIRQENCVYVPRVQAALTGQPLRVANRDPTTHNVHGFDMREGEGEETVFNLAQPRGAPELEKSTDGYEILKIKCDVHPWMIAYVVVTDHPYFAVTGKGGDFRIDGIPPGSYTVEAWHEHYGFMRSGVAVTPGEPSQVQLTYESADKPY